MSFSGYFKYIILWLLAVVVLIGVSIAVFLASKNNSLASPVLGVSKVKFSDNVWFPKLDFGKQFSVDVTAEAAIFVDTETGEVLYEKNSQEKYSIASLVKIMTTIVSLENKSLQEVLEVSSRASDMEPDKMFLIAGERLKVKELLEGIFLVSANDAAEVLAEGVSARREDFIKLMNEKAKHLGLKNTFFVNPTGLEEDPSPGEKGSMQYSTAFEVAVMSRYAIKHWPELVEISSKEHIYIEENKDHRDYDLYSGINLITTYPGVVGFKTGYTPEAGLTLVTLARRGGREVLGVLLGSTNRRDDARALLDFSFSKLGVSI